MGSAIGVALLTWAYLNPLRTIQNICRTELGQKENTLELKVGLKLRQHWMQNDNVECKHGNLEKESMLGALSGNYICTTCGHSTTVDEWAKIGKGPVTAL